MLTEGPNPYKELPYVMFKGIPVPGRFWPTSVVELLRGPQTELNKIRSQIVENAQRIGNPSMTISKQSGTQVSGVPGEQIFFETRLNAAYLGRFYLPGTTVEAMYDATQHARQKGQWVEVVAGR